MPRNILGDKIFTITGCEGLDKEFGVVNPESEWDPKWPLQMRFSKPNTPRFAIFGSPAMQCNKVTEKFDKMKITDIIDEYAMDNEIFAEKFLRGWHQMTTNGYSER